MMDRMGGRVTRISRESAAVTIVAPRRDLCLDFVNTVSWRGSDTAESLHDVTDLLRWCNENGVTDGAAHTRLDHWARGNPVASSAMLAEAITLRESLYRILFAITRNEASPARDVATLNAILARAPVRHTVVLVDRGFGWRIAADRCATAALLAPVLWSAGDLLVSPEVARLRHCANPKCLWLFLDDSKNGSRRWCSMQACGNRAKAHRHYLRVKAP
jgi:predicted RNA-binding Zn ribbon-like protein